MPTVTDIHGIEQFRSKCRRVKRALMELMQSLVELVGSELNGS